MLHHIFVPLTAATLLLVSACKDRPTQQTDAPPARAGNIPTSSRHIIPPSRRYNDLTLDSAQLEAFLIRQQLNETLAGEFRRFYNSRDFQFAWFAGDGLTEQAFAFRSLYDYSKDSSTNRKRLDNKLDSLMTSDSSFIPSAGNPDIVHTELLMTWRFINYLTDRYPDEKARSSALISFIPAERGNPLEIADSLVSLDNKDNTANPWYEALLIQLKKYLHLARAGEWTPIQGRDSLTLRIKHRLRQLEYLDNKDTTKKFDKATQAAIRAFQASHGLTPDGRIGAALIKELDIPPATRVRQILLNLERMRWMPPQAAAKLILVNIPEFTLHVLEDRQQVFNMKIVVGKEGHNTILFAGSLNQIIFNPYWNLPPSIVKKEIEPQWQKDPHYLEANDMEITGYTGSLPVIRQLPGEKNELGKMKFLFPNSFFIYFHDTPHKGLFSERKRAYSHGCIRLADARRLADYLLQPMPEWTHERTDSVLASGAAYSLRLKTPVPVLLCYFTAWAGERKDSQFREDIYGHDVRLADRLFIQ